MASLQEEGRVARLGTMGWSYPFWVGKLYPKATKPTNFLTEYAKHFNTVEIDATFYRIPSESTIESWRNQVPNSFKFAAKFPQSITHASGLEYNPEKLNIFLERITLLKDKLGPLLLQFPPYLKQNLATLGDLLEALPKNQLYATEFRNKSWFNEETYKLLRDRGIAFTLTNKDGHPEEKTADFTYIRWEGDRKAVNGEKGIVELDKRTETTKWANKVSKLLMNDSDVYGYFSKYYSGYPPNDVESIRQNIKT